MEREVSLRRAESPVTARAERAVSLRRAVRANPRRGIRRKVPRMASLRRAIPRRAHRREILRRCRLRVKPRSKFHLLSFSSLLLSNQDVRQMAARRRGMS